MRGLFLQPQSITETVRAFEQLALQGMLCGALGVTASLLHAIRKSNRNLGMR